MTNFKNTLLDGAMDQAKEILKELEDVLSPLKITLVISSDFYTKETVFYFGTDKNSNPPDDIRIHIYKDMKLDFFALTDNGTKGMLAIEKTNIFPGIVRKDDAIGINDQININEFLDEKAIKEASSTQPQIVDKPEENKKEEIVINTNLFSGKKKSDKIIN